MALPQENAKVIKTFNQKRKNKLDDDRNFHVIIAPGKEDQNILNAITFILIFLFSFGFGTIFRTVPFRRYIL